MKYILRSLTILLLAVLPLTLFAQSSTIVNEYMKVTRGMENDYLAVEKAWKKIHEKRVAADLCDGWQLWRKLYAAPGDPYHYITIQWYDSFEKSLTTSWPDDLLEGVFTEEEYAKLYQKTGETRIMVGTEVFHWVTGAENNGNAPFIAVNRMKVKPENMNAYVQMETELAKPVAEEAIRRGQMSHWGVWIEGPFDDACMRYVTVDGFKDAAQFTAPGENLWPVVFPDKDLDEVMAKIMVLRTIAGTEIWQLVDYVFPEEE
jgi:hypothetical protein